jgi:hypothetical protein
MSPPARRLASCQHQKHFAAISTPWLLFTANNINTLNGLVRWARERYPDHYHLDTRKPTGMPYGRDVMQKLWADYLNWSEA